MIKRGKGILNRSERARVVMSYSTFVLMLIAALTYLVPNEFVRSPDRPQQFSGSLLIFIENLIKFPVWSSLFFCCAVYLFVTLVWFKCQVWKAHWVTFVICFAYALSLIYGSLIAPGTYIIFPMFASYVAIQNYLLAVSYSERPAE